MRAPVQVRAALAAVGLPHEEPLKELEARTVLYPPYCPRESRGRSPHNPSFQTVSLPGCPGYALYPYAQVPDG